MRNLLRAGAIALAASSTLLGGAVAAQAAPAGTVTVKVSRLVLEPGEYGHIGSVRITIRNRTDEDFSGNVIITEAVRTTLAGADGASGCGLGETPDGRTVSHCNLDGAIAPGGTGVVTVHFRSPAAPQPFAQIAPLRGSVRVGDATAEFPALFRSTSGSLRNPRPYVQDTTAALTVTAGDVALTRQEDGTFAGRVPVTVRNDGDAPHRQLWAEIATPAGIDGWPGIEPSDVCSGASELPTPPGGERNRCGVYGGQLAEGEERTFEWVLRAPAETAVGPLGTGTTLVRLLDPGAPQAAATNVDTFGVRVAG